MSMASILGRSEDDRAVNVTEARPPMSVALLQAAAQASAEDLPDSPMDDHDHDNDQDGDDGDESHLAHVDGSKPARRPKRSRACQACRGMKIRCLPVEGKQECLACSKVNRQCIMPGPVRKRQKTVQKVADLERKIDLLTASLAAKNNAPTEPTPPSESPVTVSTPSTHARHIIAPARLEKNTVFDTVRERAFPETMAHSSTRDEAQCSFATVLAPQNYVDVIARGKISSSDAERIFRRWQQEMCPYCPLVAFSESVTVDWMRENRPMTLLAIFAMASGTICPDVQQDLLIESARQLADRVAFHYEKSIDLVHAMLMHPIWANKHKYAADLGYHQYIVSATAMCLDLGMGKRSRKAVSDAEDLERRRTWMAIYFLTGSVATVLRLPALVKFSPYMDECLDILSESPFSLPTDQYLCSLVRLVHLYEDISLVFHMDDPGSTIPLNDSRTQWHLKLFERQLEEWKKETGGLVPDVMLQQQMAVTALYIHEIAMHDNHDIDAFRPIMYEDMENDAPRGDAHLTNAHLDALTICTDSIELAMAAFSEIPKEMLRALPCLHMVWIAYVAVAAIRLHGMVSAPGFKYKSIFLPRLRVTYWLDRSIHRLSEVALESAQSPAEPFLLAFRKLKAWHMIKMESSGQSDTSTNGHKGAGIQIGNLVSQGQYASSDTQQYRDVRQSQYNSLSHPQQIDFSSRTSSQQQLQAMQSNQSHVSPLLNDNSQIDPSSFDPGNWNFNMSELNNFDTYMGDVGWMGYLM